MIVLIDPSFQDIFIVSVLLFENNEHRTSHKSYYLLTLEITHCSVMIDGRNIFDQPIRNEMKIYEKIRKILTVQGDDSTTDYIIVYHHFKNKYDLIAIDLKKQVILLET